MTEFYITGNFPKSQIEFEKRFATEKACFDYLFKMKWPEGFVCPKCGHQSYWISSKHIYICTRCESHISLTADTIMHDTKKPIIYWFKAMWWFTTRKSGINAVNLKDLLGLGSYGTAWTWLQKLRRCTIRMAQRNCPASLKSMTLFSVVKNRAKEAAAHGVKPLCWRLLKSADADWGASDCRLPKIVHRIH